MQTDFSFDIIVADSSGSFFQISEKELTERSLNVTRFTNNKDFSKVINIKRYGLIFVCLDNVEFPDEKVILTIRSSKKNLDTPVIVKLKLKPEDNLLEKLYKAAVDEIIFDTVDNNLLEKTRIFQRLSTKGIRLNLEYKKLQKENIKLKAKNAKLKQESKQEKKRTRKANKELAKELAENVQTSMELHTKSHHLTEKIKELNISKENYEHITENVPSGIVIVKKDGQFLYANSKAVEITGYALAELAKFSMKDLMHADTYRKVKKRVASRIEGLSNDNNYEIRLITKNGEIKTIETSGTKTEWMGETVNLIVFTDITRKKRFSDLLNIQSNISHLSTIPKSLDESFKQITETLFDFNWIDGLGIYLTNKKRDGLNLVFHHGLSKKLLQNVQSVPQESERYKLLQKKKSTFVKLNEPSNISEAVADAGFKEILIIPLYSKEITGALNLVSYSTLGLSDNERQVFESIGSKVSQLVTLINTQDELQVKNRELQQTLKKIQEKQQLLIQKSKLESLGEMAAGVAHEINQPLGIIFLSLENILFKIAKKNMSQKYLDNKLNSISDNIRKVKEIIDHIRTFSREQGSIIIEKVDVNQVIKKACALVNQHYIYSNTLINLDLEELRGYTIGNSHKLEQVLFNLLSNAKFALEEKENLSVDKPFVKKIHIKTYCDNQKIFIKFNDNGIGIEPDKLDKIFNPFFTTKAEGVGTGLGLSIVYGIISEMKGSIQIKSKRQFYTKVSIALPNYSTT